MDKENGATIGDPSQTGQTSSESQSLDNEEEIWLMPSIRRLVPWKLTLKSRRLGDSDHEVAEPPAKKRANKDLTKDVSPWLDQLLNKSSATKHASNESKSGVWNTLKQDLQKDETDPKVDTELADIINSLIKNGLPEDNIQEKMKKYHHYMPWLFSAFLFSRFFQLTTIILQFVYQPPSVKVLVKCLALRLRRFRFPPKEKGVFLDRQQAHSCNLEYLLSNEMTEFVNNIVHFLDTPSVTFTCSYK